MPSLGAYLETELLTASLVYVSKGYIDSSKRSVVVYKDHRPLSSDCRVLCDFSCSGKMRQ